MKKTFLCIILSLELLSCSNVDPNLNPQKDISENYKIKSINSSQTSPNPFESSLPINFSALTNIKAPPVNKDAEPNNAIDSFVKEPTLKFDIAPSKSFETVAGKITVIYKNSYKIRIDKNTKELKSLENSNIDELKNILKLYSANPSLNLYDLKTDEVELDKVQVKSSLVAKTDVPHANSIHFYTLPENVDVNQLCEQLRKLPYILNAYPTLKFSHTAASLLSRLTSANNGTKPTEPWFNGGYVQNSYRPENDNWWSYNKQRIFEGWDYYKNQFGVSTIQTPSIMPKIAIIDTGFDTSSVSPDLPIYDLANSAYIYRDGTGQLVYTTGNIFQLNNDTSPFEQDMDGQVFSHGAACTSIAASPANNGTALAGIAPGAKIVGYKLQSLDEQSIIGAIGLADNVSDIDVISISLGSAGGNVPATASSVVGNAILGAWSSYKKITVIGAGNGLYNLDTLNDNNGNSYNTYAQYGQITVGGTMLDKVNVGSGSATYRPVDWVSNLHAGEGSDYGDYIDTSAGAENIFASSFNPKDPGATSQNSTARKIYRLEGTSFAVPQVAAAVGMIKKLAIYKGISSSVLSPTWFKNLLLLSSTFGRYSKNYPTSANYVETKFLGKMLNSSSNENKEVGLRSLNMNDALVMAANFNTYNALMRFSNIDDSVWASINSNWCNRLNDTSDTYGNDSIWGVNGLSYGNSLNYTTYNAATSGYSWGYSVAYKNSNNGISGCESISGLSGVVGANNNQQAAGNAYYGYRNCNYYP